jgi:hypothetical protein
MLTVTLKASEEGWSPANPSDAEELAGARAILQRGWADWKDLEVLEFAYGPARVKRALAALRFPAPPASASPSKEYVRRKAWLIARSEQREYARMMENAVPPGSLQGVSIGSASPEHTGVGASGFRQSLVGINMVIGSGAAYFGTLPCRLPAANARPAADYLAWTWGKSKGERAGYGLFAMSTILFIEMLLFIIRATKFDKFDKLRQAKVDAQFVLPGVGFDENKKTN